MHPQSLAPFSEFAKASCNQNVRVMGTADGNGELQCTSGRSTIRLRMKGRPDGLKPAGAASTLELLRARILCAAKLRPQDWMELDREFGLFEQRSRCALIAAIDACQQGRCDLAIQLCRLCNDDVEHLLAIVGAAANAHPAGGLPGVRPALRPALYALRCVAEALPCLIANGPAAAEVRLRKGIEEVTHNCGGADTEARDAIMRLNTISGRLQGLPSACTPA